MSENIKIPEKEIDEKVKFLSSAKCNHTPHMYIDITGDLVQGTLLARIMYWFSVDKNKKSKVRIFKDDYFWIAKQRKDWWEEIRITERQYDKAIKELEKKGFVVLAKYKFNSMPTIHIRPDYENINFATKKWENQLRKEIVAEYESELRNEENGNNTKCNSQGIDTKCKTGVTQESNLLTLITNNDYYNNDYSTKNTPNSFSNEKDNSKETLELHNSPVSEKQESDSRISMSLGIKQKQSKEKPLKDMPTRAKEIADSIVDDTELSEGVQQFIEYFLEKYKQKNHREHLPLRNETLQSVVEVMLSSLTVPHDEDLENRYQCVFYPLVSEASELEDRKEVIDKYFDTDFREKCDYSLVHFTQRDIITHVMQKCSIGEDTYWFYSESVD